MPTVINQTNKESKPQLVPPLNEPELFAAECDGEKLQLFPAD